MMMGDVQQINTDISTHRASIYSNLKDQPGSVVHWAQHHLRMNSDVFVSWHWQMNHQIRSFSEAKAFADISDTQKQGFAQGSQLFEVGITPYYALLAQKSGGCDAIKLQAFPDIQEFSDIAGVDDPLFEKNQSPVPEVVHMYPDRVAFCVAQLCPVYCRYCFRKRRDSEVGLHFNDAIIQRGLEYIASQPSIRDVLITGGDPFLASDGALEQLLQRLRDISHVEIIRFGTRTPVTLPYRITPQLAAMIARYHPVWINTHFNCHEEVTADAAMSLSVLTNAGIPVGNQSVLLRGVNDSTERMLQLCRSLIRERVRPYYLFHAHLVSGTAHLRVSVEKGWEIMRGLRGKISGFGIPLYVLDTPSGKIPLTENRCLSVDGDDLLLQDLHGNIWREKNAMQRRDI